MGPASADPAHPQRTESRADPTRLLVVGGTVRRMSGGHPKPDPSPTSKRLTGGLALLLACVALWVLAGAFYAGDIGKTRDDYTWAVNDPATGSVAIADLWRLPLFWRPISLVLVRHLVSLTWDAPWIANLLTALSHAVLALAVWRWFRTLGFSLGAGVAAMVLLTLPMAYDVMHWPAAMPTALAGLCAVAVARLAMSVPTTERKITNAMGVALLTFVACCLNEQAVACMGAVALLPLATTQALRRRLAAAATTVLAVGLPSLGYILLVRLTAPSNHRGGTSTLVSPERWLGRGATVFEETWSQLLGTYGTDLTLGGFEVGLPSLGIVGIVLLLVAVVAGLVWAWRSAPPGAFGDRPPAMSWLAAFGLAWFVLGLVPFVVVQTGPIEARHVYLPVVGLLLFSLVVCRAIGRTMPDRIARLTGSVLGSIFVLWSCIAAVSLVGIQTTLRERYRMDMAEAKAIPALYPDPAPGSVFVIARAAWREADTGRSHYDRRFWSAWQMDHMATAVLRHEYGRDDIYAKHRFSIAFGAHASEFSAEGWTAGLSDGPAWDGGRLPPSLIEWDRLLVLRIEDDGSVVPIDRLALIREEQPAEVVPLPAVKVRDLEPPPERFDVRLR